MKLIVLLDRLKNKICSIYRDRLFYAKTGQHAHLIGNGIFVNTNFKLGKNVLFHPYVEVFGDGLVVIGDNSGLGTGTIVYASKNGGGVTIGNNTAISAQCYIIDCDHGQDADKLIMEQENSVEPIIIGNDVLISAGCKILKGSIIEDGAIIGAQSVVKGHISKNSIAVGIPAREIKKRT